MAITTTGTTLTFNNGSTQTVAPVNTNANVNSVNGLTGAASIPRGMQLFFTTTQNWTAPAGVTRVRIYAVGGGQGGSNLPAGGTAGIVSLGVYAPGGAQNQNPVGVGGSWNSNVGQNASFRLYDGGSECGGPTYYGGGNGGLVIGSAAVVPGTVYSVTAGTCPSGLPSRTGFCWLEW